MQTLRPQWGKSCSAPPRLLPELNSISEERCGHAAQKTKQLIRISKNALRSCPFGIHRHTEKKRRHFESLWNKYVYHTSRSTLWV